MNILRNLFHVFHNMQRVGQLGRHPHLLSFFVIFLLAGCASTHPYIASSLSDWEQAQPASDAELSYRVFLLGDAGGAAPDASLPVLDALKSHLDRAGEDAAVVFLGDNVYCCGIPDSAATNRAFAEHRLRTQLDAVSSFEGRVVFIPGNHDWNDSRAGGLEALARQEKFVEDHLDRGNTFLPDNGFPGPAVVKLTKKITLVAIDTEWWLTRQERALGEYEDFDIEEENDFLLALDEVLKDNDDDHILVVGHHPFYSNGSHAGRFPLKTHLFPLTELSPGAYVPLPVIGSLYPLYRRLVGARQDLAHRKYRSMIHAIDRVLEGHESVIYASGHDHNQQYFEGETHSYIVSGAGSRPSYVAPGGQAAFTDSGAGFASLQYYSDGSIWLEMWRVDEAAPEGRVVFRTEVEGPARDAVDPGLPAEETTYPDYSDSTKVIAANPNYQKGGFYKFIAGAHNRDIWELPVEVPYLDMDRFAGGLTPVKRGGGMQTFSLRLKGEDGYEYGLRSIDKDPSVSVPEALRGTVITAAVQDQIASIHPYGAFIIPKLAEAAGVYHTIPQLVYVPDDPRLGIYREQFGNQLMMIEVRPNDDMSDAPNFGNSDDVVSANKFYEEITGDNDHRLDTDSFVRARLFDMLLSDWDRHELQWRWAAFEPEDGQGKIYKPIPRDRDWAFNRFDGVFPSLARLGFDPKFQQFSSRYGNIEGLSKNGHWQDRRLLASVEKNTWLKVAEDIKQRITDDIIEGAVHDWPQSVTDYHGDEIVEVFKARRDALPELAEEYYELLARYVDLVGTNKHEKFEINRLDGGDTEIVIYKTSKEGEVRKELVRRTFKKGETKEVRLFGLDGNDRFEFSGETNQGILVRAIGGAGTDSFSDESRVRGSGKKAYFYDTLDHDEIVKGPNSRILISENPAINAYEQKSFVHDANAIQVFFGSNQDDGLFVGGGMKFIRHGFRKTPFKSTQRIVGNVAARTGAFNIVYGGQFTDIFGTADFLLDADYRSPNNIRNFYGLGNETDNTEEDATFYEAQLATAKIEPSIQFSDGAGSSLGIGVHLRYTDVKNEQDRFLGQQGISADSFEDQWFAGASGNFTLDLTDHPANPKQGFLWKNDALINFGVSNSDDVYSTLESSLSFYISPSLSPQITLASRIGVAHNIGDFPFYGANTLGGRRTLRGWRSNRFAGRTSFYTNAELRAKLLNFNTYIAVGDFGFLAFLDNGRVWTEADSSAGNTWHQGFGGGLWLSLFDAIVINATVGFSEEQEAFSLDLGFMY